jgi:hypothetical protein
LREDGVAECTSAIAAFLRVANFEDQLHAHRIAGTGKNGISADPPRRCWHRFGVLEDGYYRYANALEDPRTGRLPGMLRVRPRLNRAARPKER